MQVSVSEWESSLDNTYHLSNPTPQERWDASHQHEVGHRIVFEQFYKQAVIKLKNLEGSYSQSECERIAAGAADDIKQGFNAASNLSDQKHYHGEYGDPNWNVSHPFKWPR